MIEREREGAGGREGGKRGGERERERERERETEGGREGGREGGKEERGSRGDLGSVSGDRGGGGR